MNTSLTAAEYQMKLDGLHVEYRRKKREAERVLAEMRFIRKQIDVWEDAAVINVMKQGELPKKEVLCA